MDLYTKGSDGKDNYAQWCMLFHECAGEDRGYSEDEEIDQDVLDEMYDDDLTVDEALSEYHDRI